jgi:hypothetical protein
LFRIVNGVMAALFAVAVAVQYNDPDPIRWMAIYGAACAIAVLTARRRRAPLVAAVSVGAVALAWGLYWAISSGTALSLYEHMFDAWEMKNTAVEEAREASGLFIVAGWMAIVAVHAWRWRPAGEAFRSSSLAGKGPPNSATFGAS